LRQSEPGNISAGSVFERNLILAHAEHARGNVQLHFERIATGFDT
jgi:hypothetical protein